MLSQVQGANQDSTGGCEQSEWVVGAKRQQPPARWKKQEHVSTDSGSWLGVSSEFAEP